jgi:hypothetical protein
MAVSIDNLEFSPGYITLTDSYRRKTKYSVADILRAIDIPTGLTYTQVQAITGLANIIGVLVKELIERNIIGDDFLDGYGLEDIVDQIDNAGGSYTDPDIGIDT